MNKPFDAILLVMSVFVAGAIFADGVSARSYVQDGLVACYDGIENAGWGKHSDNAKEWIDLSGNGCNGFLGGTVAWTEKGWTNDADGQPVVVTNTYLSTVTGSRKFTVEFAAKPDRANAREAFFSQYDALHSFTFEHNSGGNPKNGRIRIYGHKTLPTGSDFSVMSKAVVEAGEWASVSATLAPDLQTIWKNGSKILATTGTVSVLNSSCESVIGGEPRRANMAFKGTYHAFRLYNRVLSEDEIALNAAIDAIRFNGASPTDFKLSGGYSFDDKGNLLVMVTAVTYANDGGMVKVDGEEPTKMTTVIIKQDGSESVTISAVPDAGYEFEAWTGNIGSVAFASGSASDARITITAKNAATLKPVFRKVGGLNR
ncbi:MAG: LamG domain-containing protein [Kiritimatiellae bacterium]|nr:LamG domain-containing protein [Kiritimatiellia bacterium]